MAGQPQGFAVAKVISTEPVTATAPALVVQAGDSIKMKTYLRVGPTTVGSVTVTPNTSERRDVRIALVGGTIGGVPVPATGSLEYHFQDLETGAVVPSIAGGTIIELSATSAPSRAAVLGAGGDLAGFPDGPENDYYLSQDTLPITTGDSASTATLKTPAGGGGAGSESGTWRVLTHAHGGAGTEVSSFDDDLLITVIN